ncbi:glycosyltransferase family 9 protein [Fusobacterium mortiferum]|uniref:Glycosyltransferase family 9 protein n=1 Tax=Fusobacterium mortiferum TaxID=850 RepID=A0ABS2G2K1_FUSMR|nr:glycosyltransferase family 9 protein [Fusobacterium mortiferum]MBM6874975.1 glycosyltransferase family 9 protein [Fusobacterium mortiferum]
MRILIIHTAFIGDIVLSTPLIKKLRDTYPKAEITYLTTPVGASILRNNPHLNHIIEYDKRGEHKGIKGFWAIAKKLKMEAYNLVITPHRYLRSTFLTFLTGAPIRRGYDSAAASFLYNERVHYDKSKHEVEKLLSFVPKDEGKRYEIEIFPTELEVEKVDKLLEKRREKVVVVAPGSKWFTKKWPLEYFNRVIKELEKREDTTVVVVGGKEEMFFNMPLANTTIDLRGKTTLLELAEVIRRADIVLTNDSSPIHIASAFPNVRILALFGPTVEKFGFFPWSKNSEVFQVEGLECRPCSIHGGDSCPKKHFKCMLDIKPEMVLERIESILESENI